MPAYSKIDNRWRLLLPRGSVIVRVRHRTAVVEQIRALPSGTPVAFVGGRRLRSVARRAGVRVTATYVALPSLDTPVAITKVAPESLRWTTRSILTVPSGVARWHAVLWTAVLLISALPGLLAWVPAGDRMVIGNKS